MKDEIKITSCEDKYAGFATEKSDFSPGIQANVKLDMRINKFNFLDEGEIEVLLIFKLDHQPIGSELMHSCFLTSHIHLQDNGFVLKNDILSEASINFVADIYQDKAINLFKKMREAYSTEFNQILDGSNYVTKGEAKEQVKIILNNYYGDKKKQTG